jgi:rRNA-processing protein FCF1
VNSIDFDIYKSVQQEKKLTEIYVGSTSFLWTFAIVNYTADCTEAIPFTPFDRVICGLLSINEVLSFQEIASILGFNVIDNLADNQYKDIAENEILVEVLSSLSDYGMIEKGDNFFSRCRLTDMGREYAAGGKKFRTTENKEFQLYFDLTTNNHDKAKEIFQDLRAQKVDFVDSNIDFENEQFLKSFAEYQIPEIYSSAQDNSFANIFFKGVSFFNIELSVGVLFDFQINTYRLKLFNKQTKAEYFTEYANVSEELKTQILQNHFASLQSVNQQKNEQQTTFEEKTCEIQSEADYLLFQNKPQEAITKINRYYKETNIIEPPNFWQNIDAFIDSSITELFFNIPELTEIQYNAVQQFAKARPESHIFLAFQTAEIIIDKSVLNIYSNENSPYNTFGCFSSNLFIFDIPYLIPFESRIFTATVIIKKETDNNTKIEQWKKVFAGKYIPILLQEFDLFLRSDFETSLWNIEAVQNADKKVLYFENWVADFGFDVRYTVLKQRHNELFERLKQQHKNLLSDKIDSLSNETDIDSIEKLDQINEIKKNVKVIEKECITEYVEVLEKVEKIKTKLSEKESYIKDQLIAKHYIIDTNVFVDCPEILSKIDIKHNIILSARVIGQLDKLKCKLKGIEKGNVEKALKLINQKLGKKKGNIRTARAGLGLLPIDFNDKSPDNLILCVALMYKDKNPFLLTSDSGLQAKAKICEIPTISLREFLYGKVKLPINTQTGVMIDWQILIDAYNSAIKKKKSVSFSEFNSALNNTIKWGSYKQYGFSKFKDFCNSLSEIFDIQFDEKGVECLILK